jgi:hypothetical protein
MSFYVGIDKLAELAGGTFGNFTIPVSGKMREFACGLYKDHPGYFRSSATIAQSFQRGYMRSLCKDLSPPPLPPLPFTGGRCNILYKCSCQYNGTDIVSQRYVQGPFSRIDCRVRTDRLALMDVYNDAGVIIGGGQAYVGDNTLILRPKVVPENGLADTCGDPPATYPPTILPPTYIKNYTINNDGETFNFYIKLIKDSDGGLSFPISFDINGEFNAYLDLGGFYFDIDITGNTIQPPDTKPPIVRRPPNGGGGSGGGGKNDDSGGGSGGGKPTIESDNLNKTELPIASETKEKKIEGLAYITVDILSKPSNATTQSGSPGQDIYYPGWVYFLNADYAYPRVPMHFSQNVFPAPDGADGYSVKIYKGYSAKIIKYTRKVKANT